MRIGIITHHWVCNFGANLQAIASVNMLRKLGHEAWVINYRPLEKETQYQKKVPLQQIEEHNKLCEKYMYQTTLCRTEEDMVNVCNELQLDRLWLGSDAMLRLERGSQKPDQQFPNPYWLQWTKRCSPNIPTKGTIAVSAMGTNFLRYSRSIRKLMGAAIRDMEFISVRDRWTQFMLKLISRGSQLPILCPDPVFIFNDVFTIPNEYISQLPFFNEKYILLSMNPHQFSDHWIQEFVNLSHKNGLKVVSLPFPEYEVNLPVDYNIPLPLSPLSWYSLIQRASGYLGYRMHPIVCSLANGVPFISIDTYVTTHLKIFKKNIADIRLSSKVYDLCYGVGMKKFCFTSRQLHKLTPQKALDLLNSKEQINACLYREKYKREFTQVVEKFFVY